MKKILILGGSHRDIPLIKAAQELGFFVITLGACSYYLGHKYADKKYLIDFNDLQTIKKIYFEEKITYIIPGCGEESYINTVILTHQLKIGNFDTIKTAQLVHNKWRFKEFCLKNGVSTPQGFHINKMTKSSINFPLIVKPTTLSGGRGVQIVKTEQELDSAIKEAQNYSDEIFIEEFIEGKLIAYSIFFINQKNLF